MCVSKGEFWVQGWVVVNGGNSRGFRGGFTLMDLLHMVAVTFSVDQRHVNRYYLSRPSKRGGQYIFSRPTTHVNRYYLSRPRTHGGQYTW